MDDDPHLLEGLRRTLGFDFDVVTENDPITALRLLEKKADFEVVLSDLKMPHIDGTQFLAHTKRILPAATRLLLTGVPDLAGAIAAINDGGIFRFLTKPCSGQQLLGAIRDAVNQHRMSRSGDVEPEWQRGPGSVTWIQRPSPRRAVVRDDPQASGLFQALNAGLVRPRSALVTTPPHVSQTRRSCVRSGSHLAVLAVVAETAMHEGRARDAERTLDAPLRTLLQEAQAGRPTDSDDTVRAAVLAARLAAATRDGTWLDYPFLLFCALRRLLPSEAIDEIHAALHQVRGANEAALERYLGVLEFHGRARSSTERCLLKRVQQCRALIQTVV